MLRQRLHSTAHGLFQRRSTTNEGPLNTLSSQCFKFGLPAAPSATRTIHTGTAFAPRRASPNNHCLVHLRSMSEDSCFPLVQHLDHLVITVQSVELTAKFYEKVLGLTIKSKNGRTAMHFGQQKINLHQYGKEFEPKSRVPTPGSADLCFLTGISPEKFLRHLHKHGVEVVEGPVAREGACGPMMSVYFRDPDGNLVEVAQSAQQAAASPDVIVPRSDADAAKEVALSNLIPSSLRTSVTTDLLEKMSDDEVAVIRSAFKVLTNVAEFIESTDEGCVVRVPLNSVTSSRPNDPQVEYMYTYAGDTRLGAVVAVWPSHNFQHLVVVTEEDGDLSSPFDISSSDLVYLSRVIGSVFE